EKMQILAEDLAVAKLRAEAQVATAICSVCGYTVKGPNPVVTCPVCKASADKFQVISREAVETIATQEGGIEEEESMPGVRVKWSADARDALREVTDAYLRRRAKARIEQYARSRGTSRARNLDSRAGGMGGSAGIRLRSVRTSDVLCTRRGQR